MSSVTSLGFSIFSRYDGSGTRRANRDINQLQRNLNRSSSGLNKYTGRLSALVTAAAAIGPSLTPISGVLLGVGGATAAMTATAGSALGAYALVMKGSIDSTLKLAKAHKALTPVQTQFVLSVNRMKSAMNGVSTGTMNTTLHAATDAVIGITNGIHRMVPVVRAVAPIVDRATDAFRRWTAGAGMARFVRIVLHQGVPALNLLMSAGRHVLAFLGFGFRAFAPFGVQVAGLLNRGALALQRWGAGGGFQRFIAGVQKNGPAVGEFFRQLARALVKISQAMAGLGPISLGLTTNLLRLVAALPPGWIQAIVIGFLALKTAMAISGIISAVSGALAFLSPLLIGTGVGADFAAAGLYAMLGPIALVVAAVALLGVGIFFLVKYWSTVWGGIRHVALVVWNFLTHGYGQLLLVLLGGVGIFIFIFKHWSQIWNGMKRVATVVWHGIASLSKTVWNGMRHTASNIWHGMAGISKVVWNGMRGTASNIWHGMANISKTVWNGLRHTASSIWHGAASISKTVWSGMRSTASNIWHGAANISKAVWSGMRHTASNVWHDMAGIAVRVFRGMQKTLHSIWEGIKSAARTTWNALSGIVKKPIGFVINHVIAPLVGVWDSIAGHVGLSKFKIPKPHVGFARGGRVRGPGGPRDDRIPAMLSDNEFVMNARAVRHYGVRNLYAMNSRKLAVGGLASGGSGGDGGKGGGGILGGIGKVLGGIGHVVKGAIGIGAKIKDWVLGGLEKVAVWGLMKPFDALLDHLPFAGDVNPIVKKGSHTLFQGMLDFIMHKNDEGGPIGGHIPTGARKALLMQALALTHTPPPGSLGQWLAGLNTLITRESGWNAGAINLSDSNAKAGHPSQGLMQTIPGTFNAYALPGHHNIRNGLDNVIAGIRYIKARYGNITHVQQANASLPPKGYKAGGMAVRSYDRGGYLPPGYSVAYNGTGRPERVGHHLDGGGQPVSITFEDCTFVGSSRREWMDLFVKAHKEASRKRRI